MKQALSKIAEIAVPAGILIAIISAILNLVKIETPMMFSLIIIMCFIIAFIDYNFGDWDSEDPFDGMGF